MSNHFCYSRWGNAGQLQLEQLLEIRVSVIADGGMRANCNVFGKPVEIDPVIADGGMRANCNQRGKRLIRTGRYSRWGNAGQLQPSA